MKIKGLENQTVKFVYLREPKTHKPVITVCLIADAEKNTFARGISICSEEDMKSKNYNKNIGRRYALKRACGAFFQDKEAPIINRNKTVENICTYVYEAWSNYFDRPYIIGTSKASKLSREDLTETEKKILGV